MTIAVVGPTRMDCYPLDPRVKLISLESLVNGSDASATSSSFDIVHIHALWTSILHKVRVWATKNALPIVWSPHGMLAPWAMKHKWWKKILPLDELHLSESVEFAGPKYGEDLNEEYVACDCLALVSYTENFGATVVDAMAHGKPVITSDKTPWKEVVERKCGWRVSNEPEQLAVVIREMISFTYDDRYQMGVRGRELVKENIHGMLLSR